MNPKSYVTVDEQSHNDVQRVLQTDAHFLVTSCSAESCSSCEHPLWTHIRTPLARYCPTDGRPYWRLAVAILRIEGLTADAICETIDEIQGMTP